MQRVTPANGLASSFPMFTHYFTETKIPMYTALGFPHVLAKMSSCGQIADVFSLSLSGGTSKPEVEFLVV
ncbi:hypothetical protein TNCT_225961 [Trichonephila clavata]|uniref:Uncharacterized protein n=1 Tax=Trichonephila clavata TaxID=2740835 RepID=A0A8X6K6J9_TRICU|nr:hypothetical protein TNCT_225961 [Trichonephila clavata]